MSFTEQIDAIDKLEREIRILRSSVHTQEQERDRAVEVARKATAHAAELESDLVNSRKLVAEGERMRLAAVDRQVTAEQSLAISAQAERGQRERAERLEVRADRAKSELGVVLARADDGTSWKQCHACAGKRVGDELCSACIANRDLVAGLRELLAREKAAHLAEHDAHKTSVALAASTCAASAAAFEAAFEAAIKRLERVSEARKSIIGDQERDLEAMGRNANELSEQLAVVRKQRDETNMAAGRAEALVLVLRRRLDTERTEAGNKIAQHVGELRLAERNCKSLDEGRAALALRVTMLESGCPTNRPYSLRALVRLLAPFRGLVLAQRNRALDGMHHCPDCDRESHTRALDAFAAALIDDVELARVYNEALK